MVEVIVSPCIKGVLRGLYAYKVSLNENRDKINMSMVYSV